MSDYIEHRVKSNVEKYFKTFFKIVIGGLFAIAFIMIFAYITMRLWNWLMPEIFGLIIIDYWQALGIIILAKIFFGGFGNYKSSKSEKKSGKHCNPRYDKGFKSDFSNWKYYDKFWEDEGEKAFEQYVKREQNEDKPQ
jgi:hypothetical protein